MRVKAPPPPLAVQQLAKEHELGEVKLEVRQIADGVALWFSHETEFVVMRSEAARKIAKELIAKADFVDRAKRV